MYRSIIENISKLRVVKISAQWLAGGNRGPSGAGLVFGRGVLGPPKQPPRWMSDIDGLTDGMYPLLPFRVWGGGVFLGGCPFVATAAPGSDSDVRAMARWLL